MDVKNKVTTAIIITCRPGLF